ncbi:invasion associated locus B family protein [Falsirhodobacter sp. alg1]|uniref:invasion associated locus B family protein n=1 Tax=Falsirhodobacter sp. alg1 TaxID=1472418 RepID=UPI0005EE8A65|nr:invasion associated locus B family protein [Falsirhodobacter sp. alg1]
MSKPLSHLMALTLAVGLAQGASAQTTPAPESPVAPAAPAAPTADGDAATAQGLSMGQAPAEDPMRIVAKFEKWEQRCISDGSGKERCQLYQLLQDNQNNSVAEFSLFNLPAGSQAAAGATIIVPLETLLTANLTMKIDSAPPKVYPFTWCSEIGCVARIGFTQAEVDSLKRGSKVLLTIVPVVAPDQKVELDVSLTGFTAGYEAVIAANAQ